MSIDDLTKKTMDIETRMGACEKHQRNMQVIYIAILVRMKKWA